MCKLCNPQCDSLIVEPRCCVPAADPRQSGITSIRQIAPNQLEDVAEFFRTYKSLEGRVVVIDGWRDHDSVDELLKACINAKKSSKNI